MVTKIFTPNGELHNKETPMYISLFPSLSLSPSLSLFLSSSLSLSYSLVFFYTKYIFDTCSGKSNICICILAHLILSLTVDLLGPAVSSTMFAGEASVHCDLTVHGSSGNRSSQRRAGLALRFVSTDTKCLGPMINGMAPVRDHEP